MKAEEIYLSKIRFARIRELWKIKCVEYTILCTAKEKRAIQRLQVGEDYLLRDWALWYRISRNAAGYKITGLNG